VIQSIDYHAVGPVLILAATALWLLLAGRRTALPIALIGTAAALGWSLSLLGSRHETFCLPPAKLPRVVGGGQVGRSCSFVIDNRALLFQVVILVSLAVVLLQRREPGAPPGEWHLLLLCSATGMLTIAAARDLLTLVVALEVLSLPSYALAGLRRGDRRSSEAALKFFLVSVVSSAVTLLGMALLYGLTGSLQLDRIAGQLGRGEIRGPATAAAVVLTLIGFLFKVSAVPFHAWAPDTYEGAPLTITCWLAVASKVAGFAGLLTLLTDGLAPYANVWGPVLAVLAALTMTVGNIVALAQRGVVRLLAWSSIAQAGYVLAALAATRDQSAARSAALAYIAIYAVTSLAVFAAVGLLARGGPLTLDGLRGRRRGAAAVMLTFAALNLAGAPPGLAGLFAKLVVVRVLVNGGLGWLAVFVAVNTALGLAVYLRLVAPLFAAVPDRPSGARHPGLGAPPGRPILPALAAAVPTLGAVAIGVYPTLVLHLTDLAGR
jgi:NADH-quinone oxidoreductase subunit N